MILPNVIDFDCETLIFYRLLTICILDDKSIRDIDTKAVSTQDYWMEIRF